jgi:hypothetical protein
MEATKSRPVHTGFISRPITSYTVLRQDQPSSGNSTDWFGARAGWHVSAHLLRVSCSKFSMPMNSIPVSKIDFSLSEASDRRRRSVVNTRSAHADRAHKQHSFERTQARGRPKRRRFIRSYGHNILKAGSLRPRLQRTKRLTRHQICSPLRVYFPLHEHSARLLHLRPAGASEGHSRTAPRIRHSRLRATRTRQSHGAALGRPRRDAPPERGACACKSFWWA